MKNKKVALWVNRRSDLGNITVPTLGANSILVDAAIGDWPKRWNGIRNQDLIGRKIDQKPVSMETVNSVWNYTVGSEKELQVAINQMTIPGNGEFSSFEYLGKLGKMLRTAMKKSERLYLTIVQTIVIDTI